MTLSRSSSVKMNGASGFEDSVVLDSDLVGHARAVGVLSKKPWSLAERRRQASLLGIQTSVAPSRVCLTWVQRSLSGRIFPAGVRTTRVRKSWISWRFSATTAAPASWRGFDAGEDAFFGAGAFGFRPWRRRDGFRCRRRSGRPGWRFCPRRFRERRLRDGGWVTARKMELSVSCPACWDFGFPSQERNGAMQDAGRRMEGGMPAAIPRQRSCPW